MRFFSLLYIVVCEANRFWSINIGFICLGVMLLFRNWSFFFVLLCFFLKLLWSWSLSTLFQVISLYHFSFSFFFFQLRCLSLFCFCLLMNRLSLLVFFLIVLNGLFSSFNFLWCFFFSYWCWLFCFGSLFLFWFMLMMMVVMVVLLGFMFFFLSLRFMFFLFVKSLLIRLNTISIELPGQFIFIFFILFHF